MKLKQKTDEEQTRGEKNVKVIQRGNGLNGLGDVDRVGWGRGVRGVRGVGE